MDEEETNHKIEELKVLDQELHSLKKDAAVYRKFGCGTVFFLGDRQKIHSDVKLDLDKLSKTVKKE